MVKITFLGDIMCEGPLLKAAHKEDGTYDFSECFQGICGLLTEADYVIGNLETPLSGEEAGYTKTEDLYSFNTPIEFAEAVKEMGMDLVLTANNHCCDRGIEGLIKTLETLEQCGLNHTGTYKSEEDSEPFYFETDGIIFAVISCTSGTNAEITKISPDIKNVNLLDEQVVVLKKEKGRIKRIKSFIVKNIIGIRRYMRIRKFMGKSPLKPYTDDSLNTYRVIKYVNRLKEQIERAKQKANYIFLCLHMGGQFNAIPGKFSEYMMNQFAQTDVDAIICSHPHIVQKAEIINHKPCFYSIGNVSMSMGTEYIIRENLPDYGLAVHFYMKNRAGGGKITCSVIKMVEDSLGYVRAFLVSDLYDRASDKEKEDLIKDIRHIGTLMGVKTLEKANEIDREVELFVF